MVAVVTPTKLDLACGANKRDGFFGVDLWSEEADLTWDLLEFPWPFESDSVEETYCCHYVEHIPHRMPEWPRHHDGLWLFMDELWRVCKHDAKVQIVAPYALGKRAFQDSSHERFIVAETFLYYTAQGREQMGIAHYPIRCDFEIVNVANSFIDTNFQAVNRHPQAIEKAVDHDVNVVGDLMVDLRALKG